MNFIKYQSVSEFPSSARDLSFSVKDANSYQNLQKFILNIKDNLLKEVFIFDFYKNEKKEEIKIGFRFIFQSQNKTVTELEVSNIMAKIIDSATSMDSVEIPGLN